MLTRRTFLPILATVPFRGGAVNETIPRLLETHLLFGGDVMLSRWVGHTAQERGDPALPLREIAPLFQSADIAFANLESPFSDRGHPYEHGMIFKAAPEMIASLEVAGIDIVSTANNHARDCDAYGVGFTLEWLEKHGIAAVGSGTTAEDAHAGRILSRNGIRFGFLAYTYDQSNGNHSDTDDRVAVLDAGQMRRDVASLRDRADIVIVSMHAGLEYSPRPNAQQTSFARSAIDAGATLVVGHHPHVVQPWEHYGSGVIFYSLGNLVFDQFQREETQHGVLAQVSFSGKEVARVEIIPVDILHTGPRLSTSRRASAI